MALPDPKPATPKPTRTPTDADEPSNMRPPAEPTPREPQKPVTAESRGEKEDEDEVQGM